MQNSKDPIRQCFLHYYKSGQNASDAKRKICRALVKEGSCLYKNSMPLELLLHPPYSPDLAPFDYHLFRSLSKSLKDIKFENVDELKRYLQDFFDSKPEEFEDHNR